MFSAISNISLSLPHLGFPFKKSPSSSSSSSTNPHHQQAIKIPRVEVHDVEITSDKRGRRLKHLLKLNHATFSILYNRLRFHNHTPHILGSAYLLGGTADHLTAIYEDAATNEGHEHWTESPSEIAEHDYRDYLGRREFQRAFVDFFEDELVQHGYDWKDVVEKFLFERGNPQKTNNIEPIFNCLTAGLGHPLIHLGYAYELNSREVAMEALGLAATCYDRNLARLFESEPEPQPQKGGVPPQTVSDLFELFTRVHNDTRLDSAFDHFGGDNLSHLLADPKLTSILLEHWHSWSIDDATRAFEQSQGLATALLISTSPHPSIGGHGYDFFIVHLLTTSHAVRILVSFLDAKYHVPLVREWLLITLAIYIAQLRPVINKKYVTEYDLQGRDWDNFVVPAAVQGKHKFDAHFVKACRAMKEAEKVWGGGDSETGYGKDYWLKAAVRFTAEFDGWGGFGPADEVEVRELREQEQEQQQEEERKRQSQSTGYSD
ncbi:hypothetical protein ABEF95_005215 [Exophiala dermatitidis]